MEIEIGNVKYKSVKTVSKEYVGKRIREIVPSCYCTEFKVSKDKITVLYEATNASPYVLQSQGFQKIYQYGTIYYEDGTVERLTLNGKIVLR